MMNEESQHQHRHNKLLEDSKIDLLDVPLREDIIMGATATRGKGGQIVLKMRGMESRNTFGGTNGGNRRLTGNTTISSNNSLLTSNDDIPKSSKF